METWQAKEVLRRAGKAAREAISPAQRQEYDAAIADAIRRAGLLDSATGVAGYRSRGSEASVEGILESLIGEGRRVYLPRVAPGRQIELCRIMSLSEGQRPGAFGILEPEGPAEQDPGSIDAILTPGVGFDRWGVRVGYGMGYYDRLLRRLGSRAIRIGIAYEAQVFSMAPADPWDEPMDWIVTEAGARPRESGPRR